MFKELLLKKLMERQLAGVPDDQKQMIISAFEKNPDFFMKIAQEAEVKTKSGMDRMTAAQQVFAKHADELKQLLGQ